MRIEVDQAKLAQAMQKVARAVAAHSPVPILSGILFQADSRGLLLTASSVTMSIRCRIAAEEDGLIAVTVREAGGIVLPAAYVDDIVRKLPAGTVTFETNERLTTVIRSGKSVFKLLGMDPEEFPALPAFDPDDAFVMPGGLLRSMIRQVVFAVASTESRPLLTGVLWRLEDSRLKLVATDGVRMALRHAEIETQPLSVWPDLVIPGKNLNELSRLLRDQEEPVRIYVTSSQITIQADKLTFYSGLLDGSYPNVDKIIPSVASTRLIVETQLLLSAIERVSLLAKDGHVVKLSVHANGMLELSSTAADIGDSLEEVEAIELNGEPLTIHFNAKYMSEALRSLDSTETEIRFAGPLSPIVVTPSEHAAAVLHLVTSMRSHT